MTKKKTWSIVGILVVVVGGTVALMSAKGGAPKAIDVRAERVERRDLVSFVVANGQIQPRKRVALSSDITGRIVSLTVKEGEMVAEGQVLLRIDPAQYEAAVSRAEATLASVRAQAKQSEANLQQSQNALKRKEDIRKTNPAMVSDEEMEQARTTVEVQKAVVDASTHSVEQAVAGLTDATNNLSKTTVRAPMSGRVTRLSVQEGETAIMGTLNKDAATLLVISDMGSLETRVRVDETDVSRIVTGDSAEIQLDAFPDTTFLGRVVQISNSSVRGGAAGGGGATGTSVDYEVVIQLLNPPTDTRPDFSATAKIVTAKRKQVIAVPITALTIRENTPIKANDSSVVIQGRTQTAADPKKTDESGVFVIGPDNKVTFRAVKIGITGERYFEVLDGLQPGDLIVGGSYQAIRNLRDGALVRHSLDAKADSSKAQTVKL